LDEAEVSVAVPFAGGGAAASLEGCASIAKVRDLVLVSNGRVVVLSTNAQVALSPARTIRSAEVDRNGRLFWALLMKECRLDKAERFSWDERRGYLGFGTVDQCMRSEFREAGVLQQPAGGYLDPHYTGLGGL
jgi:hypothetical protein